MILNGWAPRCCIYGYVQDLRMCKDAASEVAIIAALFLSFIGAEQVVISTEVNALDIEWRRAYYALLSLSGLCFVCSIAFYLFLAFGAADANCDVQILAAYRLGVAAAGLKAGCLNLFYLGILLYIGVSFVAFHQVSFETLGALDSLLWILCSLHLLPL